VVKGPLHAIRKAAGQRLEALDPHGHHRLSQELIRTERPRSRAPIGFDGVVHYDARRHYGRPRGGGGLSMRSKPARKRVGADTHWHFLGRRGTPRQSAGLNDISCEDGEATKNCFYVRITL
jgi:hypothetical protein